MLTGGASRASNALKFLKYSPARKLVGVTYAIIPPFAACLNAKSVNTP
jgi:hypothetical protein